MPEMHELPQAQSDAEITVDADPEEARRQFIRTAIEIPKLQERVKELEEELEKAKKSIEVVQLNHVATYNKSMSWELKARKRGIRIRELKILLENKS